MLCPLFESYTPMTIPPLSRYTNRSLVTLLATSLLFLSACTNSDNRTDQQLTIFAAASLTDAFTEVVQAYEAEYDGSIQISYAGSSTLATQILEGAQVDLFASANLLQIGRLQQENRISQEPVIFASNQIVVVIPTQNPAKIDTLMDLTQPQLKLVLAAPGVPIRQYTDLVWAALSNENNFGGDFAEKLYANVVSEEDNVRQVLAKITLGEADAAFVYRTDITSAIESQVLVLEIPKAVQPEIAYPIVMIDQDGNTNTQQAQQFITFLTSRQGQCILAQYHFVTSQASC